MSAPEDAWIMEAADPQRLLPQRPPILMLDKVVDIVPGEAGVGVKHFQADDPCFAGHFPGQPILPGVLAIEALAQTALVALLCADIDDLDAYERGEDDPIGYLAKVNNMSFHKTIEPDQTIRFKAAVKRRVGAFVIVACEATRGADLCVRGELTLAMDQG